MTKIIRPLWILGLILFLSSCQLLRSSSLPGGEAMSSAVADAEARPNWDGMIVALVEGMVKAPQPAGRQTLLVGDINNMTKGTVPEEEINGTIRQQLSASSQYRIVNQNTIDAAKEALGFSLHNPVVLRSKIIAEARYLGVDLILLSQVQMITLNSGRVPEITFELLSTRSGEILWHSSSQDVLTAQPAAIEKAKAIDEQGM